MVIAFGRARRGVAAIEFALTLPILMAILCGCVVGSQALEAVQKVSTICSDIADLTAQLQTATPSALSDEFSAADVMISPLPQGNLTIRISSVVPVMANGQVTGAVTSWCQTSSAAAPCPAKGSPVTRFQNGATFPTGMLTGPSSSVVVSEVGYTYAPPIATTLTSGVDIYRVSFLVPRSSTEVSCPSC